MEHLFAQTDSSSQIMAVSGEGKGVRPHCQTYKVLDDRAKLRETRMSSEQRSGSKLGDFGRPMQRPGGPIRSEQPRAVGG